MQKIPKNNSFVLPENFPIISKCSSDDNMVDITFQTPIKSINSKFEDILFRSELQHGFYSHEITNNRSNFKPALCERSLCRIYYFAKEEHCKVVWEGNQYYLKCTSTNTGWVLELRISNVLSFFFSAVLFYLVQKIH